jgi:hypothetical protein
MMLLAWPYTLPRVSRTSLKLARYLFLVLSATLSPVRAFSSRTGAQARPLWPTHGRVAPRVAIGRALVIGAAPANA